MMKIKKLNAKRCFSRECVLQCCAWRFKIEIRSHFWKLREDLQRFHLKQLFIYLALYFVYAAIEIEMDAQGNYFQII